MQKAFLVASLSLLALSGVLYSMRSPGAQARRAPLIDGATSSSASEGSLVSLSAGVSHPVVLAGDRQEVVLHLGLQAAELPAVPRLGMNLALVIDRSGSMASEGKLTSAKSAAEQLVGRLRPDDRLAIVAYDDEIRTVVPSTLVAEKEVFLAAIRELVPGNSTDLFGGMMRGYEEVLAHFDERLVNGVLLLSDGLANRGVTDQAEIARHAAECRRRGVRISTMGMGLEYDEDLLTSISQNAGGRYYYVGEPESVGAYLDEEIDDLGRIVARELELRVALGEGVELRQVFGHVHRVEAGTVIVPLRDMVSGRAGKVVMTLGVRGNAGERRPIAEASLRYVDAATRASREERPPRLEASFSASLDEVQRARNLDVLVQAEIVQNAVALDAAMELRKQGNVQAAQELLAARYLNSKTVNATEYKSAEVDRILNRMLQVMQELERTRSDPRAARGLLLATDLEALGYMGGN